MPIQFKPAPGIVNSQPANNYPDPSSPDFMNQMELFKYQQEQLKNKTADNDKQKMIADYRANPGTAFNPRANPGIESPKGADGRPLQPGFVSIGDESTGLLKDPYLLKSTLNSDGLNQLRQETLRQGPSRWSQLQQQVQGDNIAQSQASQVQNAQNSIASQGGLRSGAGERLAGMGVKQGLMARQQMQSNLANQDEQNRQTNLRALPGMELANAGYNDNVSKYNIDSAKGEMLQRRAFDANAYNEAMRAWGAERTAAATPSSGKK